MKMLYTMDTHTQTDRCVISSDCVVRRLCDIPREKNGHWCLSDSPLRLFVLSGIMARLNTIHKQMSAVYIKLNPISSFFFLINKLILGKMGKTRSLVLC